MSFLSFGFAEFWIVEQFVVEQKIDIWNTRHIYDGISNPRSHQYIQKWMNKWWNMRYCICLHNYNDTGHWSPVITVFVTPTACFRVYVLCKIFICSLTFDDTVRFRLKNKTPAKPFCVKIFGEKKQTTTNYKMDVNVSFGDLEIKNKLYFVCSDMIII